MGNPPFYGHQWRTPEQQEDMKIAFADLPQHGKLDYVCAWYAKTAEYLHDTNTIAAFVSTNSICQGESVGILWRYLFSKGINICFAHQTFIWSSEASDMAHVHCVIVGITFGDSVKRCLYSSDEIQIVNNINGYLFAASNVFIENRGKPINPGMPAMTKGSQPTDGGNLILSVEEREELLAKYPELEPAIKLFLGGKEFIRGEKRYCLWLKDIDPKLYANNVEVRQRLEAVRLARQSSPTKSVREAADIPALFTQIRQPSNTYIAIPEVSSENRKYIPIDFLSNDVIASNKIFFIPIDSIFAFGLLCSQFHNAWIRVVAGRLKSDYSYSPSVYNSFVFPKTTEAQKQSIEQLAQSILDTRAKYPESSLADLYDPLTMPPDLLKAHKSLDRAVEKAYDVNFNGDESKIVAHLFELYAEKIK
jgi:hypothetical protein